MRIQWVSSFSNYLYTARKWLIPCLLTLLSVSMYTQSLEHPSSTYWDENYHIPSAQKNASGVLYMEPHPPLGKMLMSLSEYLIGNNDNIDMSRLLKTDFINTKKIPKGMQFFAFRLPSALLMGLSIFFFYHSISLLTQHRAIASVFSLFFIFDNALAVHTRAAMLEGIQLFFVAMAIWYVIYRLSKSSTVSYRTYSILGGVVGLAVAVKLNSLILCLLLGILVVEEFLHNDKKIGLKLLNKLFSGSALFFASLSSVVLLVMYLHIGLNSTIVNNHTYKASSHYLHAINTRGSWHPETFYYGLQDNYRYIAEYEKGIPRLDPCKKGGENGSYWLHWPWGGKAINYRWKKEIKSAKNLRHSRWNKRKKLKHTRVAYSYLVANPFIWFSAALGIFMSATLIVSRLAYGTPIKDEKLFRWISYFTLMYISYLIAISQIERVMYLYHYFIPLIFAILNLSLLFTYLFKDKLISKNYWVISSLVSIALLSIGLFIWFSPLTYSTPLTDAQFTLRNWLAIWEMTTIK